jgi:uncharacterized GH25 family protein
MTNRVLLTLSLLLLGTPGAIGHDYWLMPESFVPVIGKPFVVHLHVGDAFVSEAERPFQKKPTVRFQLFSTHEVVDLTAHARDEAKPVARITCKRGGTHLLALERAPQLIKLEAEKFTKYLKEEGLDAIVAQRRKLGEDTMPGRERYRRYLKSLVQAGGKSDDTWKRVLGQRLEIVPLANSAEVRAGAAVSFRVLFDGKPLSGARVFAYRRAGGKTITQTARTSATGLVRFKLDEKGPWLVRLVHMRRATGDREADWESFWAALTFSGG